MIILKAYFWPKCRVWSFNVGWSWCCTKKITRKFSPRGNVSLLSPRRAKWNIVRLFRFQVGKREKMKKKTNKNKNKNKTKNRSLERTALQLSLEWLHFRISSMDSKVGIIFYSIIKSTTRKYFSAASFQWLHLENSFSDSKVRTTLHHISNGTIWMYGSVPFIWMVKLQGFTHRIKS